MSTNRQTLFHTLLKSIQGEKIETPDNIDSFYSRKSKAENEDLMIDYIDDLYGILKKNPSKKRRNLFFDRVKELGQSKGYEYIMDLITDGRTLEYSIELYKVDQKGKELKVENRIREYYYEEPVSENLLEYT